MANVGVIAGLVLVAVQINENTEITKAQIANDYFLADINPELAMMSDDPADSWVKAVYAPDDIRSIAVVPFEDISPGRDQAYLANGIADELRTPPEH